MRWLREITIRSTLDQRRTSTFPTLPNIVSKRKKHCNRLLYVVQLPKVARALSINLFSEPPIFCYKCKTEVDNKTLAAYKNAADIECSAIAELKRVLDVKYVAKENCADYEICAADITQTPDGHCKYHEHSVRANPLTDALSTLPMISSCSRV